MKEIISFESFILRIKHLVICILRFYLMKTQILGLFEISYKDHVIYNYISFRYTLRDGSLIVYMISKLLLNEIELVVIYKFRNDLTMNNSFFLIF